MVNETKMNVVKFKGTADKEDRNGKAQGAKSLKKSIEPPAKAKKAEGAKKAPKKSDEPPAAVALWNRGRQYLREVSYELRKVVWPSRKETLGSTSVVLVIVILTGIFLGIVDMFLSRIMRFFVG
jgi:preprotein translocase subunit SecE